MLSFPNNIDNSIALLVCNFRGTNSGLVSDNVRTKSSSNEFIFGGDLHVCALSVVLQKSRKIRLFQSWNLSDFFHLHSGRDHFIRLLWMMFIGCRRPMASFLTRWLSAYCSQRRRWLKPSRVLALQLHRERMWVSLVVRYNVIYAVKLIIVLVTK